MSRAPHIDRRSFLASITAVGGALTLGFEIPFALASPRSGGRGAGVAVAILISVGYWVVHSVAVAFAKAELLPPMLGAWTANIIFAGLGAALFLRAKT